MIFKSLDKAHQSELAELFTFVFTTSEGEAEGKLVGNLASVLASNIDNKDIICFGAYGNEKLLGAIFYTSLNFNDATNVYMLAPVAVHTEHQGKGVGTALINFGLNELKKRRVNVVVTYGDPSFYSKVGFEYLPETIIQAPLTLSMPFGWLGQSLTEEPIPTLIGRPSCVEAFNDQVYW